MTNNPVTEADVRKAISAAATRHFIGCLETARFVAIELLARMPFLVEEDAAQAAMRAAALLGRNQRDKQGDAASALNWIIGALDLEQLKATVKERYPDYSGKQLIEAVKFVRNETSMGLAESRKFVGDM